MLLLLLTNGLMCSAILGLHIQDNVPVHTGDCQLHKQSTMGGMN